MNAFDELNIYKYTRRKNHQFIEDTAENRLFHDFFCLHFGYEKNLKYLWGGAGRGGGLWSPIKCTLRMYVYSLMSLLYCPCLQCTLFPLKKTANRIGADIDFFQGRGCRTQYNPRENKCNVGPGKGVFIFKITFYIRLDTILNTFFFFFFNFHCILIYSKLDFRLFSHLFS